MQLLAARITGYQSFTDSGEITFADGINLIIGQNNSGKSALLRALQSALADDRHRTPEAWQDFRLPRPEVRMTILVSGEDLRGEMLRRDNSYIPIPEATVSAEQFLDELFADPHIPIKIWRRSQQAFGTDVYPSHERFTLVAAGQVQMAALVESQDGMFNVNRQHGADDSIPAIVESIWGREMFFASAERMTVGESSSGYSQRLLPNASNLPQVVSNLNGERHDVFNRLVGHICEIFSTIGSLSVRITPSNTLEIRVWPTAAMDNVALSFPLNSSGTGVSQVVAILTAVMTSNNAVVMIDEISTFLHPAATKTLLRILQTEYGQHQYIITTHSPEVIGFSNPKTVHLVKRNGYESSVRPLDISRLNELREVAEHLGVSMSDVFAADRVIWVEGPTEELCFPMLYRQATGGALPRGTIFTSVIATGDFIARRRDRSLIYQIYSRLSAAALPLVVSVAFSFDSEALSDQEKQDMERESGGLMHFLPRRHLECYLIDPAAIAQFINDRDANAVGPVEPGAVAGRLVELAAGDYRMPEWTGDIRSDPWLSAVDAARLISTTVATLTEHRVTFNKKDDTLALLQHIQAESPDRLVELAEYVRCLVDNVGRAVP